MDDTMIATVCLCDDLLKAIHHHEDCQCHMNDAEIMTTALVASLFFRGNHESARAMLKQHGYIPSSTTVVDRMLTWFHTLSGGRNHGAESGAGHVPRRRGP